VIRVFERMYAVREHSRYSEAGGSKQEQTEVAQNLAQQRDNRTQVLLTC
jgi:hypothetical protein